MSRLLSLTTTYHRDTYPAISPTHPSLNQAGKTILITGGGGGIGFEIARSFAKASASRIIIMGRRAAVLEVAAAKLREEFQSGQTEFIFRQGDISDESSVTALWDFFRSEDILVHVLVLNAVNVVPEPVNRDTLSIDRHYFMEAFNTNLGGNFSMTARFVKQPLRAAGQQLNLVHVSTAAIHMHPPTITLYALYKTALADLLGRVAEERSVEDVQIISFHPGLLYTETASKYVDKDLHKWDAMALPGDFSVWAASPEAAWLHGHFVWAHWDVVELKTNPDILKQLGEENGFLKVGVQGLTSHSLEDYNDV